MANDRKNQYIEMSIYFNKNCKEDMAIYRFLSVSKRRKSKFIVRALLEYLRQHDMSDIGIIESIPEKEILNFIEFNEFTPEYQLPKKTISIDTNSETELLAVLQKLQNIMTLNNSVETCSTIKENKKKQKNKQSNKEDIGNPLTLPLSSEDTVKDEIINDKSLDYIKKIEKEKCKSEQEITKNMDDVSDSVLEISQLQENDDISLLDNWEEGLESFEI